MSRASASTIEYKLVIQASNKSSNITRTNKTKPTTKETLKVCVCLCVCVCVHLMFVFWRLVFRVPLCRVLCPSVGSKEIKIAFTACYLLSYPFYLYYEETNTRNWVSSTNKQTNPITRPTNTILQKQQIKHTNKSQISSHQNQN